MLYDAPEHLKSIINRFVEKSGVKEPLSVKIQTNLPPSRGLGSSAAVAVAFVRASYDFMDQPLDDKTLKRLCQINLYGLNKGRPKH